MTPDKYELAKKVVQYIACDIVRESAMLSPTPTEYMADPYGLLDLIKDETGLSPEVIDAWMVEAQHAVECPTNARNRG